MCRRPVRKGPLLAESGLDEHDDPETDDVIIPVLRASVALAVNIFDHPGVPEERDFEEIRFPDIELGVETMFANVAASGAQFQAREQKVTARDGQTRFLTINLLRLQDAERRLGPVRRAVISGSTSRVVYRLAPRDSPRATTDRVSSGSR